MSQPAVAVGVTATTADTVITSRPCIFKGWSLREAAGTAAAAQVTFRDGTTDSAPIVAVVDFTADQTVGMFFDGGIRISTGLFMDRPAGQVEGAVYIQ